MNESPCESHIPLTRDSISAIHDATVEVLSKTGFCFECEKVQAVFKKNGFRVEDGRVYITETDIENALSTAPKSFTIRARNPVHDVLLGRGSKSFGLGRGAVHMVGPDGASHRATMDDHIAALKLAQMMDEIEHVGPLAFPTDIEAKHAHLRQTHAAIKYTDKVCSLCDRHDIDLMALAFGTNRENLMMRTDLKRSPGHGTCNVQSPLTVTVDDCDNLKRYAECGIAFHVASMPLAGTSGPCTLAGIAVLQNAENLAPIVLSQLVRPGCAVFFGSIAGHADMISLKPCFGTPEARLIERAGCQMARFYGLPSRGNTGLTDASAVDFQSGAQAMLSALSVFCNGASFLTGCGLLGSYMGASLAKVVLDAELMSMVKRYLSPIATDRNTLAADVIRDVGPGGHFIEHSHTLHNFRSEISTMSLFKPGDYRERAEEPDEKRRRDVVHSAHERALSLIDFYERPYIDPGLEQEIDGYVQMMLEREEK